MHRVLIMGAGKIGSLIAFLLAQSNDYIVQLADVAAENPSKATQDLKNISYAQLDASNERAVTDFIQKHQIEAVISSLPYYCNARIAKIAAQNHIHYFDLTEDVKTTEEVATLANKAQKAFVPQCGLAPGFISIVANDVMTRFDELDTVKMRVGALPINSSNALQYSLTWSTDGLINEYGNICHAVEKNVLVDLMPLEGLENIKIDGLTYEAFNTSGGIGSLTTSYQGKVQYLSYKTIRYPGHCAKIKFLMEDLKLNEDRDTLKRILERVLPKTYQDVVLVYVSVTGMQNKQFIEESYVKKFYPKTIAGHRWSAIQLTTASGICAALDLVLQTPEKFSGLVNQEQFSYQDFIHNRFGAFYA